MTPHDLKNKMLLKLRSPSSIYSKNAPSIPSTASTVTNSKAVLSEQPTRLLSYLPLSAAPPAQGAPITITSLTALSHNAFPGKGKNTKTELEMETKIQDQVT